MKRRKFVQDTVRGLSLIVLSPTFLTACSEKIARTRPNGKTVVVIGAGIAGLAAAQQLRQEGYTVVVLEAQEKVGGRIRTDRSLGFPFDEGASWVHGPRRNPIMDLAEEAGAKTYETEDDSVAVYDIDGTAYDDERLTLTEERYDAALESVLESGKVRQDFQTVFDSLFPEQRNDRLWKYMLSAYLEFSLGGDISNLSSVYFDDDEVFKGADRIITNGYDRIPNFLAKGLDIRLNERVEAVQYSSETIKVSTGNETYDCDYAVVAVPLGVLRNASIAFSPELPARKVNAIENTKMGTVNKFLLVWEEPFWDSSLQYIGFTPETKGKFNYFLNVNKYASKNALMTFAFGDYASLTERMTDAEVIDEIMDHLRIMYGNSIPNPIHFKRTKWGENINSFGAYSFATNGSTSEDFDILSESVNNKLFFAGEHTDRAYRGTVHGAYLSGLRAAADIIG